MYYYFRMFEFLKRSLIKSICTGLVVKLVEKTNSDSIKIGNLDLRLGSIPRKNAPKDIVLTMDDVAMRNKYFPVDTKEDHKQKKIDVVEEKLSDKNKVFFQKVVSITLKFIIIISSSKT